MEFPHVLGKACGNRSSDERERLVDRASREPIPGERHVHRVLLPRIVGPEVRRAVQALSSLYVERRASIDSGAAFSSAGKRAAFAMYFAPLHFLLVRAIVRALAARVPFRWVRTGGVCRPAPNQRTTIA